MGFQKATEAKQGTVASNFLQGGLERSLNDVGKVRPQDGDARAVRCAPRKDPAKQKAVCAVSSRAGRVELPESPGIWAVLPHVPYTGQGTEGLGVSHSWFQSSFDLIFPCFVLMASFLNGNVYFVPSYIGSM